MLAIESDRVWNDLTVLTQQEGWASMFETRWLILGWIVDKQLVSHFKVERGYGTSIQFLPLLNFFSHTDMSFQKAVSPRWLVVRGNNVSPIVWGFLILAIKYDTSQEARSAFVEVVTAVWLFTDF
jgi:hypothetical protein